MSLRPPPTVLQPGVPASAASLSPEQRLRQQAELAELAFGSAEFSEARLSSTQHLAFLPPEELALDLDDPQQRELGDYTLLEKLGQGGMGVVYRARQNSLDREVAIKLLAAGPWASRDFIERFRREAQSAARMQHPNIVGIYEIGRHDELNFFSMRLVRGPSLAHLLAEQGPMAPRAAAQLLRTVAEAVDYAHRLGVLHLDLKPGNVLIDETGTPLVADFGLARRMDETLGHDTDEVSGTPSYMAPEQAQLKSHRLSAATDIYGLGAIGYEMLAGRPPFQGDSPHDTLMRVVTQPAPSLRESRPGVPADLAAIVGKCLAKEPEKRYASARALADDLARFLDGRAVSVRVPSWHERLGRWAQRDPRLAIAASALLATLVTGIVATSFQWKRAESNAAASRTLLWEGRREAALRLAQDGKGQAAMAQLLANVGEAESRGNRADAARDRQRLGLLAADGATLVDTFVVADSSPFAVEISPDGHWLAIAFTDLSVRWYDTATLVEKGRISLANRGTSDGQRRPPMLLRFADSGHLIVTLEWFSNLVRPTNNDSWLVDLDKAEVVEPPAAFADPADASYSADGGYALLRDRKLATQLWRREPWQPVSAVAAPQVDFLPWLIDPRGRFALELRVASREIVVHALPSMQALRSLNVSANVGVSAWMLSGDGRTLALGDFEGRVFLVDTATWAVRALPSTRGREITWLAFSEDDAWLAAAGFDGAVQAFDAASGDALVSGRMQADFAPRRLGLSHAERLLVVAGLGRAAMWRLPAAGPRALAAQRVGFEPAAHGLAGPYAIGWSLARGLLATAGVDGQVRLYRLPLAPLSPARAARQPSERMRAHGDWLVDTEWDQLRLLSTRGARATAWRQLAQPAGYAELLGGDRVVLTVGTQLQGLAAESLAPAFAPLELGATPQRMLADPAGGRVLLAFGRLGDDGPEDVLQVFDVRAGRRLPGEAVVRGPLRMLAWSADGTRILAVGPGEGATSVFAAAGLRPLGAYEHDPFEPVQWADFDAAGAGLVLVTRATDPRFGGDALVRWQPGSEAEPPSQPLPRTGPIGVLSTPHGDLVTGLQRDLWWPTGAAAAQVVPRRATSEPLALAVASPDGRLIARAFRHEVQLLDARTAAPIGQPLWAGIAALDTLVQLSFSDDSRQLRARSVHGGQMVWPIAAESRPVATLARELARVDPNREDQGALRMPAASERAALRARDPGAWPAQAPRPPIASDHLALDGSPIPRRVAATPANLVALDRVYTNGPDVVRNTFYSVLPSIRPFPAGVQRIGGADFDVRGMVQIGIVGYDDTGRVPDATNPLYANGTKALSLQCLPVAPAPVAAVHLLLRPSLRSPVPSGREVGRAVLHFVDGTQAVLPIRAGVEIAGYTGQDQHVPQVFATDNVLPLFGIEPEPLSAPRLANPTPQRPVRCVDLSVDGFGTALLVLGLTLEPPPATVPAPATAP